MMPSQPLTVTLEAQHWDMVMRAMAKAPYEIVAPLIQSIQQQCMQQTAVPTNGAAEMEDRPCA